MRAHWHIDPAARHATSVPGPVGDCCEPYASWEDVMANVSECAHENARNFRDGDGGHRKCLDCGKNLGDPQ